MKWFSALPLAAKIGIGIGVLIAVILAVAALVSAVNAHDKAQKQAGRDEVQAKWNDEKAARATALADFQTALGNVLQPRFDNLATMIGGIDTKAAQINVELPKAVAADPRYRSPDCALTQPVRDQINAARALTRNP